MDNLELPNTSSASVESPITKPLYFGKGLIYALTILFAQLIVGGIVLGVGVVALGLGEEMQQGDFTLAAQEKITNLIMAIALPGSFLLAVFILLRRRFAGIDMIYLFIGGVIIGPICEEIIFRGIIQEGFLHTYSPNKAILFSALIFGGIHLVPLQVLSAFLAGLLLGWIYWKTRSLWIVMILHIINNYIAFSFTDLDTHSAKDLFSNELFYYGSFGVALLVMYGSYILFNKSLESNQQP